MLPGATTGFWCASHSDRSLCVEAAFRSAACGDSAIILILENLPHSHGLTCLLPSVHLQNEDYSILTNNCHAFVSSFMNLIGYGGKQSW